MTRITNFLKHNAIAIAALFIALGGTSYAAVTIPKNSVGSSQLRSGAVSGSKIRSGAITPGKLASGSFGGRILGFVEVAQNGQVLESDPKGIKTEAWSLTSNGGVVQFPHAIPKGCYPLVSSADPLATTGVNGPAAVGAGGGDGSAQVVVRTSGGTNITLAIICSQ